MTEQTKREVSGRRFHFGLGMLLLAIAGIASVLGSCRLGYDLGYLAGQEQWRSEAVYPHVYNVGDITDRDPLALPDFDTIIENLTTRIEPQSWQDVGGPGAITGVGRTQLLIGQTADAHDQIRTCVQSLRDGRLKLEDEPEMPK